MNFLDIFSKKYSDIKFHENLSKVGWTDRHGEAKRLFSQDA